jgi:isopentenyl diphosphate isomerase/L-lactate dehydrogenase-like FMN-dependent dehydrogenase
MSFDGRMVQNEIYIARQEHPWPLTAEGWEERAREALPDGNFGYIAGGAGAEATMRANLEAFRRYPLKPRMLRGTAVRDLSVEVLGTRSAAPFLLAPIGVLSIAHEDAELAAARAAAAAGIPFVFSSAASTGVEEVAGAMGDAPRWFQLYWINDREVAASWVARAEAAGYSAIVMTLDTSALAWRPRDLRTAYLPFMWGEGCGMYFSDPVFCSRLDRTPADDVTTAAMTMISMFPNLGLTWDDLDWLRAQTELPLLVKGVLTAGDARLAIERGVDGICVSNHGGRQVDGAVASLDALVEVRAEVGDDYPLLVDGGIRTGADVLKAIALGADAVLLGRPYAYGLAAGGQEGVAEVIRQLMAETDLTMALLGARSPAELDRSWIAG